MFKSRRQHHIIPYFYTDFYSSPAGVNLYQPIKCEGHQFKLHLTRYLCSRVEAQWKRRVVLTRVSSLRGTFHPVKKASPPTTTGRFGSGASFRTRYCGGCDFTIIFVPQHQSLRASAGSISRSKVFVLRMHSQHPHQDDARWLLPAASVPHF